MNSALKPVLTSPTSQNPPMTSPLNKPMHPQNTPATYGQPSTHMPPSLVNLPHNNPNVAHSHPNPAHQTNHYSLNVPNAQQLYSTNTPSAIPPSNHPVTSQSAGQAYANKNTPFAGAYQPNLGHPPNANPLPPVSQNLPASQPPVHPVEASSPEKPQSNGTTEAVSPSKAEAQNHIPVPIPAAVPALREVSPQPAQPSSPKVSQKEPEAKAATPEPVQEPSKTTENREVTLNVDVPASDSGEVTAESSIEEIKSNKTSDEKNESSLREVVEKAPEKAEEGVVKLQESETNQEKKEKEKDEEEEEKEDEEDDDKEDEEEEEEEEEEEIAKETREEVEKPKEKEQPKTTPTLKAAPRTPTRKSKTPKSEAESPKIPKVDAKAALKSPTVTGKSKRTRIRTQPYQSPLPEIEIITKISSSIPRSKANDDKLIVFYKNEFLAVRNLDGGFFVCQAVQNIYKSSPKIRIRWLSMEKSEKSGEVYTPDFYDNTDFDCILTNLNLTRVDKGRYRLPPAEKERTDSILQRSLAVEKGEVTSPSLTEEHPDGIDVSLYKQESQLKKRKGTKRKASSPLKSAATTGVKTPDKSKVRKVAKTPATAAKKIIPKRIPQASITKTKRPPLTPPTPTETKKVVASSSTRTDRAKRRSDSQTNTKVSPVVDQKKAKVLAKVARKGALNVSGKGSTAMTSSTLTTTRNTKAAAKAPPSPPKVQNKATKAAAVAAATPSTSTRKTKRSLRK